MRKIWYLMLFGVLAIIGCAASRTDTEVAVIEPPPPYIEIKLTYNFDVYEKPSFFLPKTKGRIGCANPAF